MQTQKTDFKDHTEEVRYFKKWLLAQKLNTLQELYAMHLYFNVDGWDAINEWLPNKACSRRVPRRGAKVVKSKSKICVGRTRG